MESQIIRVSEVDDGEGFLIQELDASGRVIKEICIEREGAIQLALMILNTFLLEQE
jgi:hypothetical protein